MQKKTSVEGKLPGREFGNSTVSKVRIDKQWLNPGVPWPLFVKCGGVRQKMNIVQE